MRNGAIIIPEGTTCLEKDDTVIVISSGTYIMDLNDIYLDEAETVSDGGNS